MFCRAILGIQKALKNCVGQGRFSQSDLPVYRLIGKTEKFMAIFRQPSVVNKYLLEYDSQSDAAYIWMVKGKISRTIELDEYTFVDLDKDNRILGMEILNFSSNKVSISQLITKQIGNAVSMAKWLLSIRRTAHSLVCIHERELSKEMVEDVISNPDKLVQIEELKRTFKQFDDSVVDVVCKEINSIPFIITAYRSTDTKRYLK